MWIARRGEEERPRGGDAALGVITLGGGSAGVYLEGERRGAAVWAPRGYHWSPMQGEEALVVSCGEERSPCILGVKGQMEDAPGPGEVLLSTAPGAGILLKRDGSILLMGQIYVNGAPLKVQPTEEG